MANPKSISYSLDDDVVSDDLLEKKAKPTILEQLRTEVAKKVERPEIEIPIPERAGVSVRFSPNISQNQLRAWRRNSGENSKDGFDP